MAGAPLSDAPRSDEVRVALVGAGRIGQVHAAAYRSLARGRLVACTDPNAEAARSTADRYGLEVVGSFEDVLARDDVDAVLLATPNWLHAQMTVDALAAGKHVFCQKPMALTLADADRVVVAADASDRVLQYGFMLRFTPPLPELRELVVGGAIGDVIAARAAIFGWEPSADWFYDKRTGGGVILDTMIHFADLVRWLVGEVERVHADGGAYVLDGAKRHGSPDNASVSLRHVGGAVTNLYVSWTAGHGNFTLELYGTDGNLAVDLVSKQVSRLFLRRPFEIGGRELPSGWSFPDLVWSTGYAGEQQAFVDRVAGHAGAGQAAGARDGRAALALALAAQRSLDEQRVVDLANLKPTERQPSEQQGAEQQPAGHPTARRAGARPAVTG
jgi:myo-inositol 2-dehydrogenase/D-chiro-inositol 1-dehydrogenase